MYTRLCFSYLHTNRLSSHNINLKYTNNNTKIKATETLLFHKPPSSSRLTTKLLAIQQVANMRAIYGQDTSRCYI